MASKTLILGIGNTLLGDEGVGVHVANSLRHWEPWPDGLQVLDGGTLSFTLAGAIGVVDGLIVIDAARLEGVPGTVRVFEGAAMDRFVADRRGASVHEVSLLDLLTIAKLSGDLPRQRALIGIEPGLVHWSDRLSDRVERAVPLATGLARDLVARWSQ